MTTPLEERIQLFANQATDDLCDNDLINAVTWPLVEGIIADMLREFVLTYELLRADGILGATTDETLNTGQ